MSAVARAPAVSTHASYLAFDFGTRRIGVASGNSLIGQATPLRTVDAGVGALDAIGKLVDEWRPDALVVGVPRHPDGVAHANTRRARRFAGALRSRFGLAVHEVDERYSTTEARTTSRGDLDAASAAIILDQFLRERSMPEPLAP
jgi:putative Holliday junction resolvase